MSSKINTKFNFESGFLAMHFIALGIFLMIIFIPRLDVTAVFF